MKRRAAHITILSGLMVLTLCVSANAQRGYTGPGPYVGIGPAGGFPSFQGNLPDFGNSVGFNARGGYRFNDFLAAEALYEYMDDFGSSVSLSTGGNGHLNLQTNNFSLLGKVILPTGTRIEPFLDGGVGFLNTNADANFAVRAAHVSAGKSDTEFAGRIGAGVDVWLTDHIAAYVDSGYVMPTSTLSDLRYFSLGGGIKYSFAGPPEAPPPPPPAPAAARPVPPTSKKIVLRGVRFDFNKATIRPDARPVLDAAIATLKREASVLVIAEGHTDNIGSESYNLKLSRRRAEAVRDYLVAGGVSPRRITVEGLGESHPVASNATADGRAQNRRVELRVRSH